MGRLIMKAAEGKYRENNRELIGQFINGINYDCMASEIRELTFSKSTSEVTGEKNQNKMWSKRIKAQSLQTVMLKSLKWNSDFDSINKYIKSRPKSSKFKTKQTEITERQQNSSRYCGSTYQLRLCAASGKTCNACGKLNHLNKM